MDGLGLRRVKSHFKSDEDWIYSEVSHPEWVINRVLAICKWRPLSLGLIGDFPCEASQNVIRQDYKVAVWDDNIGYCGDLIGEFNYCRDLGSIFAELGEYAPIAATQIWEISERLSIPLADYAPTIFSQMICRIGVKTF